MYTSIGILLKHLPVWITKFVISTIKLNVTGLQTPATTTTSHIQYGLMFHSKLKLSLLIYFCNIPLKLYACSIHNKLHYYGISGITLLV